jgi:alkylation response protein AidB-like acyl-CoA dehydrogenase
VHFKDSPAEVAFRSEARSWLAGHAEPRRGRSRPAVIADADPNVEARHIKEAKAWQRTCFDGGWAGITWPPEHGGRGGTAGEQIIFDQEQARFDVPPGVFAQGIGMAGPTIIREGHDKQQERFLRPMLRGDEIWCQLFSEPGAGSDLAAITTRAVPDGDAFVVDGQKVWTSSAHFADWGILLARTSRGERPHAGLTYFLLDMRSPGVEVRPLRQMTGACHFNEVFLTGVRVPVEHVVGTVGDGWRVAMTTLGAERTLIGTTASGLSAFDDLLALARDQDRCGDPLARQELARAYARTQVLRYLGWRVQTAVSHDRSPGPESSVLKLALCRHLAASADTGMALAGPSAAIFDQAAPEPGAPAAALLGQWASRLGGGTEQIQANIVGERVLGLPREPRGDTQRDT